MSRELIMMRGLPLSGKSTLARAISEPITSAVLSRKNIYDRMIGSFSSNVTVGFAKHLVRQESIELKRLFNIGYKQIIVDSCNLNPMCETFYRKIAQKMEYDFKIRDIKVDLDVCLRRRDLKSNNNMSVIDRDDLINMAFKYKRAEHERKFVLIELEGIIADIKNRILNAEIAEYKGFSSSKDYFYDPANLDEDEINTLGLEELNYQRSKNLDIILITRRPKFMKKETEKWLKKHEIKYDRLIMADDIEQDELLFKMNATANFLDLDYCEEYYENNEEVISYAKEIKLKVNELVSTYEKV